MPQTPSTRWCPTREQVMILEEMYRSGVRTPNASYIQQITAHLSLYGKIEGKNVFYWFQNHKARDRRQKLRRPRLISPQYLHLLHHAPPTPPAALHFQLEPPSVDPLSSTSQLNYPIHFLHQVESTTREYSQGMDLLCKLEASDGPSSSSCEWTAMMDYNPRCRPIRTLDLFPTTTTGLKDEYTKYSSSCSTTIN